MSHDRRRQRRYVRQASRRRRRGGHNRAPVSVQRFARRVEDTAYAARSVGATVVAGNRPLVAGLIGLLVVSVIMLSGPLQNYVDGRDRVDLLQRKLAALEAENDALEARRDALQDPEQIELLAREHLGMHHPGEVPYAIVPPPVERPRITTVRDVAEPAPAPWYVRAWRTVTGAFG